MATSAADHAHNADLEVRALEAERDAPEGTIHACIGKDGRAKYGRTGKAAWLRAQKVPVSFRPAQAPIVRH